jgi:hypothetical protein
VAARGGRAAAGDAGDKPASLAADGVRQQMAVMGGGSSGLITTALHPFAPPLAAFEYGGVCHVEVAEIVLQRPSIHTPIGQLEPS